jgi:sortase A
MMELMRQPWNRHSARRRTATVAGLAVLVGLLTACGGSGEPSVEAAGTMVVTTAAPATTTSSTSTTTTTLAPTTTTTSTTSTTTSTTSTTSTTTTTVVQATKPIAPPADPNAKEPLIEMGSIVIPKIDVDMKMYEGIRMTTLDYGPGHWPGTALPGQVGNVVVGGHRTSKHRVFRHVDQLVAGDEIIFNDANGAHVYIVNRVEIVNPDAIWIVDQTPTATATLFACHPPGSTSQRIVVFADLAT